MSAEKIDTDNTLKFEGVDVSQVFTWGDNGYAAVKVSCDEFMYLDAIGGCDAIKRWPYAARIDVFICDVAIKWWLV